MGVASLVALGARPTWIQLEWSQAYLVKCCQLSWPFHHGREKAANMACQRAIFNSWHGGWLACLLPTNERPPRVPGVTIRNNLCVPLGIGH